MAKYRLERDHKDHTGGMTTAPKHRTLLLRLPAASIPGDVMERIASLLPGWEILRDNGEEGGGAGPAAAADTPSAAEPPDDPLRRAEIVIGGISPSDLRRAERLRWVQMWGAGVDALVREVDLSAIDTAITNMSGIHETPMAEHTFALLLALSRGVHHAVRSEPTRGWAEARARGIVELRDKRMLIVGMGHIGTEIARIAQAFRMEVHGVRRTPQAPQVDAGGPEPVPVSAIERLPELLPEMDVVVVVAPLTPETERLFGADAFSAMKPESLFINLGRGPICDEAALIDALRRGEIAGAGLDVFETEPLPAESPLWEMENVVVTAHYGGVSPRYNERAWQIALDNLERYAQGRPLRNVVDPAKGY